MLLLNSFQWEGVVLSRGRNPTSNYHHQWKRKWKTSLKVILLHLTLACLVGRLFSVLFLSVFFLLSAMNAASLQPAKFTVTNLLTNFTKAIQREALYINTTTAKKLFPLFPRRKDYVVPQFCFFPLNKTLQNQVSATSLCAFLCSILPFLCVLLVQE